MSTCKDNLVCQEIRQAIAANRQEDLQSLVSRVAQFTFKDPANDGIEFSNDVFECIIEAMTSGNFQQMEGSDALLVWFEYDWSLLTVSQKAQLITTIELTYAYFRDSNACFVLAELLGEYFCNREALDCLARLTSAESDVARALTAHGFRQLAKESLDADLKAQCFAWLKVLADDKSTIVRREALEALHQLNGALTK